MPHFLEAGDNNLSAKHATAVTPSDSVDLVEAARAIYLGVGGDVKLTTLGGDVVTFVGLAGGVVHPITAIRIWSTGTTASSIVRLA